MKGKGSPKLILIYVPLPNLKRCRGPAEYSTVPALSIPKLYSRVTTSNPFRMLSFPLNRLNLGTRPVYQGPL
jgi:hypothetical protein